MRVGVYVVGLNPAYAGGLTTYAVGLINGLLESGRPHRITTFINEDARSALEERMGAAQHAAFTSVDAPARSILEYVTVLPGLDAFHVAARNRRMRRVAEQIAAECDVVLFPLCVMATYELQVPSIVSFHDLQHEVYPHFFDWRSLRARRVRFGATFRHATLIQASSVAMKDEALRVYADRLRPERVVVIPEGVDYEAFAAPVDADARHIYGLPEEFMFYPAQLWHHKNHLRLLQALDLLRSREGTRIPLVLTGAEYEASPAVRQFVAERKLADQVFILGRVPYPHLRSLYRQACYVLSASLHESNCLPVLEAAASGTPMIVADIAPNRESAQLLQLRLFDPLNVEAIAAALLEGWRNRDANAEAVAANREAVRRFDWTAVADMYISQAERLLADRSPRAQQRS